MDQSVSINSRYRTGCHYLDYKRDDSISDCEAEATTIFGNALDASSLVGGERRNTCLLGAPLFEVLIL
jgi:hypothetical protein